MPTEMEPSENSIQLTGFGPLDKVGLKEKSLWVLKIYIIYIPGPAKGVKFQPPRLFLVLKGLKFQTLAGSMYISIQGLHSEYMIC